MNGTRVLVIGGTDSSGGAGLLADLRALSLAGVDGAVAVTAVTAQTMTEVRGVAPMDVDGVQRQIDAALDEPVAAVKVGLLPTIEIVNAVSAALADLDVPIVVDPVFRASAGHGLAEGTHEAVRTELLPVATIATPNVTELSVLISDVVEDLKTLAGAAAALARTGPAWVLATGGHLPGPEAVDVLTDGERIVELSGLRLDAQVRGTGCTLASLVAARLALGDDVVAAARTAKDLLSTMLGDVVTTPSGLARFRGPRRDNG